MNYNLTEVHTLVIPHVFDQLLINAHYDDEKRRFLIEGFTKGFNLEYQGPKNIKQTAPNLKLTVGSPTELWNKVIKEVALSRYAGPFENIPFTAYIQSPIGLVPKDNGTKTRLIFHLSYPRERGDLSEP